MDGSQHAGPNRRVWTGHPTRHFQTDRSNPTWARPVANRLSVTGRTTALIATVSIEHENSLSPSTMNSPPAQFFAQCVQFLFEDVSLKPDT
jgi:hypothetical protein